MNKVGNLINTKEQRSTLAPILSKTLIFRKMEMPDMSTEPLFLFELLGEGSSSVVHRCSVGGFICAAKKLKKPPQNEALIKEVNLLLGLFHPNIIQCFGYDNSNQSFTILLELCHKGTLWNLMHQRKAYRPFEPQEINHYLGNVARGIYYLHCHNIFHRDIKSANVLIDGDREPYPVVKLSDFGLSTTRQLANTLAGTPQYMAPEILKGQYSTNLSYSAEKADVWSFGMLVIELLTLDAPYPDMTDIQILDDTSHGKLPNNLPPHTFHQLLKMCVVVEPSFRATAKQLVQYFVNSSFQS